MMHLENFNIDQFQETIESEIRELLTDSVEEVTETIIVPGGWGNYYDSHPETEVKREIRTPKELTEAERANALFRQREIRARLCAALQTGSNDVFEISKIVTPILISLRLAGTSSIPIDPLLFATVAIIISRIGIASLCKDYKSQETVREK